ncbi:MAG: histone deacetylase [Spirochaetales bacterium]
MILYNSSCTIPLLDFGILIPIQYDKQERVFQALKEGALSSFPVTQWHRIPSCTGITKEDLIRAHTPSYVDRLFSEAVEKEVIRTFELIDAQGNYHRYDPQKAKRPLKEALTRALAIVQGTYETCQTALETGFAYFLGGGMHHAVPDHGAGFCLVNDLVISLRKLQAEQKIQKAWVIDVDAHKGDGTAVITYGDPTLRTLSIHMAQGWPLDTPMYDVQGRYNLSYTPSDIDIGIAEGEEEKYLNRLEQGLKKLENWGTPDLALVVDGSDPFEKDELPSTRPLALKEETLLERDLLIYRFLQERNVPSAWVMAGGYGKEAWKVYVNFLSVVMPPLLTSKQ